MSVDASAPVIVAVDLSPSCLPAAQAAAWLCRELSAPAVLIYAVEPGAFKDVEGGVELTDSLASWAVGELDQLGDRLFGSVEVETVIVETANAPSEAICDEIERRQAQLVVMGTHGRTALSHALYGSTATSVVRHAPCDVLTVRPPGPADSQLHLKLRNWVLAHSETAGIGRILCAVDFSPGSERAFRRAVELARRFSAGLDLVHALPTPFWPLDEAASAKVAALAARAAEELDRLVEEAAGAQVSADRHVVEGGAADEILLLADSLDPDLVVVGTHGRTGLKRWTIGSVAESVVRSSRVPVWTVRHAEV
jgi:nucleotide-binding universal stress UspA family protein